MGVFPTRCNGVFFSTIAFGVDVVSRSSALAASSMPVLAFAASPAYVSAHSL